MTNVTHSRLVRMSIKKADGPQWTIIDLSDEAGDMTFHSGKWGPQNLLHRDGRSFSMLHDLPRTCEKSPMMLRATIDGFW